MLDANIILDVVDDRSAWSDWSMERLVEAKMRGPLEIDPVVYAEVSVRYDTQAEVDELLKEIGAKLAPSPATALFAAGKAFMAYRRRGGAKSGVLPDFLIGAHALARQLPLLTRDIGRYRTYFPGLELIAP